MAKLVAAEKQTFEMKGGKNMIGARKPLRHSVVVCVLCFECKFKQSPRQRRSTVQASICANTPEAWIAVTNQPNAVIAVRKNIALDNRRIRSPKCCSNNVVIHKWRTHRNLRLL